MPRSVVFIHGLWLHSSSWRPLVERFGLEGYQPVAPGWPGGADTVAAARETPEEIAGHGIDDVVAHYAAIIAALDGPPVLVGHSFGGMIAEKLLGQGLGAGAVAIDAAQIKGVLALPLSALRATLPVLRNPANSHRAVSLTADQFRYGFGNAIPREESDELYEQRSIPAPGKPLFEAASANFHAHSPAEMDTANSERGPLLLIGGGEDHTVPTAVTHRRTGRRRAALGRDLPAAGPSPPRSERFGVPARRTGRPPPGNGIDCPDDTVDTSKPYRGHGLPLIRALIPDVHLERGPAGTAVHLRAPPPPGQWRLRKGRNGPSDGLDLGGVAGSVVLRF